MLDRKKTLFLLGGYDLEMLEIKKLLDEYNYGYVDKKLSWGAKLSAYKNVFDFEGIIYGIELEEDIVAPQNYILIDHHNENWKKDSSLEQVASLLNIELKRHQMLVAKNDAYYIEGMKDIFATKDEVDDIRKKDRQAQGVTQEDELLAKKSIDMAKSSYVIFSYTDKFSAVSDKIYKHFSRYVIYNDSMVMFYNYKTIDIVSFLENEEVTKEQFYYGGGDYGFVGVKKNSISKKKIENITKEFLKCKAK